MTHQKSSLSPFPGRLDSWLGHARQARSERLIRRLAREWVFRRDAT